MWVALARALAARPKLLLLDEPFSALDENLREDMRNLVLKLHREFGMTTILVTHDRQEALSMSDRVAVMENGVILQMDTPRRVYTQPVSRWVADFFGGCVYLRGKVTGGIFRGGSLEIPAEYPDGEYDLLLRSRNFRPEIPGEYPVTVESIRFRGENSLVLFRGEDGTPWQYNAGSDIPWKPGERILATVRTENPLLFPIAVSCDGENR